jgi:hypothetical protein
MSDQPKADAHEPSPIGEVSTPTRTNGERHRRSAAIYGGHKLTWKQNAFCEAVVLRRCNRAEAYRFAYSAAGMKASTIWVRAAELSRNGRVKDRIRELAREMAARDLHDAAAMRDRVLNGLLHEAEHAETASARVQAWVALGKMFDITPPPKLVGDAQSLRLELVKRLCALLPEKPQSDACARNGHENTPPASGGE